MKRINPFCRSTLVNFCIGSWDIPYPQVSRANSSHSLSSPDESKKAPGRQSQSVGLVGSGEDLLTMTGDIQYQSAPLRDLRPAGWSRGKRGKLGSWGG